MNEKRHNYLKNPSLENDISYKRVRTSCTKILKKQKRQSWKNFCNQFNFKTISEIWSLIKVFKKRKLFTDRTVIDSVTQLKLYQDTIDKLCPPSYLHVCWASLKTLEEEDLNNEKINHNLEISFSKTEYDFAINNMKLKSAPGLDQIDYNIIFISDEYAHLLLEIYNNILSKGLFPLQWKQSLIVLILKTGGVDVRPISLLSCFLKVIEKMLYIRIRWYVEHSTHSSGYST